MMLLVYLGVAAGIAYVLHRYFPAATKRWFYRIQAARKTIFTIAFVSTMLAFLLSGVTTLVFIGGGMAILAFVQIFILEDEHGVF